MKNVQNDTKVRAHQDSTLTQSGPGGMHTHLGAGPFSGSGAAMEYVDTRLACPHCHKEMRVKLASYRLVVPLKVEKYVRNVYPCGER